jgi:drug/metabolite transporter (DMT)-like permease
MTGGPGRARLPALAIAGTAVIWGLWWLPLRALAERGLPGDWASLAVYGTIFATLAPYGWWRRAQLRAGGANLFWTGALLGVVLVTWNHALLVGEVVRVVLLFYLAPVWAPLFALFLLKERIGTARAFAIVLGLSGASVVLGFEAGLPLPGSLGDWLGLASGILFALSATLARRVPEASGMDRTFVTFAFAALVALPAVWLAGDGPSAAEMLGALPLAAALGILGVLPATWLLLWGAARLDPGRVSILLLLEVVAASVSANLFTDEPFGWREALGGALILSAGLVEAAPELRRQRR